MADPSAPQKGVLPKNLQTWVLIGITVLVIGVIALAGTGGKSKNAGSVPAAGATPPAAPKTPADQYAERLEQLKADAERAQQEALTARNALEFPAEPQPATEPPTGESEEDEVRKVQARREYTSLFATQLARSYRTDKPMVAATPAPSGLSDALPAFGPQPSDTASPPSPQDPRLAELDRQGRALAAQEQQLRDLVNPSPPAPQTPPGPRLAQRPTTGRNATLPGAQQYALLEGSLLETALLTRINSDFTGPVIVQTTAPVYTRNRQHVLVPAGSRVIGEAKRTEAFGQTRLIVVFHRLLMPDGFSVDLDQFSGMSPKGESALADDVNHHYLTIFGSSIALGLLGGLSALGTNPVVPSTLDEFRLGTAASFGQTAARVLDKFTNILPTITIREGHRVRVWIAQDLVLPAYDAHAMPKDL